MCHLTALTLLFASGATVAAAPSGRRLEGHGLSAPAKLSLAAARSIALKARAGTVRNQELETEKGGSGLRYSFDILSGGTTYEVGVDARTGAILENGVGSKKD